MRTIGSDDLADLARGAALLGTGGGGDPHVGRLLAEAALREHGPVTLVDVDEVPEDAVVLPVAMMGAPTVMGEELPSADQVATAVEALARYLGRTPTHLACIEAGGVNSTIPFVAAAQLGLPLVDGDGMGRAFPELQMVLPTLAGMHATPMAIVDEKGNRGVLDTISNHWAERLARTATIDMGCSSIISLFAMSGADLRRGWVPGTLSLCDEVGRTIAAARAPPPRAPRPGRGRGRRARRPGAAHRQGRRRRPAHHHRLRPRRGHRGGGRRGRRLLDAAALPERAPDRRARRHHRGDDAGPDHGAGDRHRGADHHRGAALRPAGERARGAVRPALAHPRGAGAGRAALLRLRHRPGPRRPRGGTGVSWELTREHLPDLARGAALLGTGGGGDPFIGRLLVERAIAGSGPITVLDPDDLDDDALVIPTAQMGAPTVTVEKIPRGTEPVAALRALERHLGRTAHATMPIECGGINSMIPLLVGARTGLPVVDADGMGRAFPELQMETFSVYGIPGSPLAIAGENDETAIIDTGADNRRMESFARAITIRLGGVGHIAEYAMSGADVRRTAVPRTLSLALSLGRAIRLAREEKRSPFDAIRDTLASTLYQHVRTLFEGKVTDVDRRTTEGFAKGVARIAPADGGDDELEIRFQNENLIALRNGEMAAIVPDLICVVDSESAEPITTEGLRYGQ